MPIIRDGHLLVFPIQKCGFLPKVKEIKRLCGGVVYYAAQANAQIDAEIRQKDHSWMETRLNRCTYDRPRSRIRSTSFFSLQFSLNEAVAFSTQNVEADSAELVAGSATQPNLM